MKSLTFNLPYLAFSASAEPYQRADDVGYAVTEFMWHGGAPFYPIGALVHAQMAGVRLGEGEFDQLDEDNTDLVFRMPAGEGCSFFEIIFRSSGGTAYGGWLWGRDLRLLDTFVNGRRVLSTTALDGERRFEYCCSAQRYRLSGTGEEDKALLRSGSGLSAGPGSGIGQGKPPIG